MRKTLLFGVLLAAAAGCGKEEKSVAVAPAKDFTLAKPVVCIFQEGQSLTDHGDLRFFFRQKPNSRPIVWRFAELFHANPVWSRDGESGPAAAHVTGDGVTLVIPRVNGMHVVTLWGSGASVWTKHDVINGLAGANQFLGVCENSGDKK
ncbi:MAG: hypothetical protein WC969_08815 [Elusimicrobiota bacterium]|jgi:hypothetical protein